MWKLTPNRIWEAKLNSNWDKTNYFELERKKNTKQQQAKENGICSVASVTLYWEPDWVVRIKVRVGEREKTSVKTCRKKIETKKEGESESEAGREAVIEHSRNHCLPSLPPFCHHNCRRSAATVVALTHAPSPPSPPPQPPPRKHIFYSFFLWSFNTDEIQHLKLHKHTDGHTNTSQPNTSCLSALV